MTHKYKARIADYHGDDAYERGPVHEAYSENDAAEVAAEYYYNETDRREPGDWPLRIGVRKVDEDDDSLGPETIYEVHIDFSPEFSAFAEAFDHPKPFTITNYFTRRAYCTKQAGHDGDCGDFSHEWDGHSELPAAPYCQRPLQPMQTHEAAL